MPTRVKQKSISGDLATMLAWPMLDQIPRMLSQVDRNMHSPTYGCACRNHWHYRVEDIANIQMQGIALSLAIAWKTDIPDNPYYRSPLLLDWIEGMLDFAMRVQQSNGAFEETYRGHESYAATALLVYYLSETVLQLERHLSAGIRNDTKQMLNRAAQWLSRDTAERSGNHVAVTAAACMNLAALDPGLGYKEELGHLLDRLNCKPVINEMADCAR